MYIDSGVLEIELNLEDYSDLEFFATVKVYYNYEKSWGNYFEPPYTEFDITEIKLDILEDENGIVKDKILNYIVESFIINNICLDDLALERID